jgi:WD40 repeat protein
MIKIWNPNNGKLKRSLNDHTDKVTSLKILPNGDLMSASSDETIKIWNPNAGI